MEPIVGFAMLLELFSMMILALIALVVGIVFYAFWKIATILHEAKK